MLGAMKMGNLKCGFFLHDGKAYFASPYGDLVFHHLIADGKISTEGKIVVDDDECIVTFAKEEFRKFGITRKMLDEFKKVMCKKA